MQCRPVPETSIGERWATSSSSSGCPSRPYFDGWQEASGAPEQASTTGGVAELVRQRHEVLIVVAHGAVLVSQT